MLITRKIELWIADDDKNKRIEQWKYLRELNDAVFRAANTIVNEQYFNELLENRTISKDGRLINIDNEIRKLYKNKEKNKEKLEELKQEKKGLQEQAKKLYGTSKQNVSYQISSRDFPEIHSNILTSLNASAQKTLKSEWNEIKRGDRSVRTYRKGIPIPFQFKKAPPPFEQREGEIYLHWISDLVFKLHFGRDRSNNRTIVERAMKGEYKYSDSSIQIKDNKIFLLFVVDVPNQKTELNNNLSVGVDLGIAVPAYCALSEGQARKALGNKDDFLKVRLQMQGRRRRLQHVLRLGASGGKGRTKKLKTLDSLEEKEKNFARTYNHMLSHNIVKFAKDNRAAVIKMEFLEGIGEDEKKQFILRNWSYYQLQTLVEYKAKREGIEVQYIDPYHTSQTCALCGHYEEGQREKQNEFICKDETCNNHNEKINADYNAACNIAKSIKFVTRKEDCEYYKKTNEVL